MRLWSLHPCYLDAQGLVALWREGLLAQRVLSGGTRGYRRHPQLLRFMRTNNPAGAIASYLRGVVHEADRRAYQFNKSKIGGEKLQGKIPVTNGQIEYEFTRLLKKLKERNYERYKQLKSVKAIKPHPLIRKVRGGIAEWEIV